MIELNNDNLQSIVADIFEKFEIGMLISHKWLKNKLEITRPNYNDFKNEFDFYEALETYEFEYMGAIDKLRNLLLNDYKYYLKNIRGDGYVLLHPKEQTDFAKNRFKDDLRKVIKSTENILSNVNYKNLDMIQLKDNADALAKLSQIKNMVKSVKI